MWTGQRLSQIARGCLSVAVLALVLMATRTILDSARPAPTPVVPRPAMPTAVVRRPEIQAPQAGAFATGDGVLLQRPGGTGKTVLAKDEEALDLLIGSKASFPSSLREQGRAVAVANGTPAVVLEAKPGRLLVRIAD